MIVILRGHVRNAFDNDRLYQLLKSLHAISPLQLYIHTWDIQQNSLSWRSIPINTTTITDNSILTYLRDLSQYVRAIYIDKDGSLPLVGSTTGSVLLKGGMPKLGWKHMWAGMHKIMEIVRSRHSDTELVLNTRFDVGSNSNNFNDSMRVRLYSKALQNKSDAILFFEERPFAGCDNFFIGPVSRMYTLLDSFHMNLDAVQKRYPNMRSPHEHIVYLEARYLEQGVVSLPPESVQIPPVRARHLAPLHRVHAPRIPAPPPRTLAPRARIPRSRIPLLPIRPSVRH